MDSMIIRTKVKCLEDEMFNLRKQLDKCYKDLGDIASSNLELLHEMRLEESEMCLENVISFYKGNKLKAKDLIIILSEYSADVLFDVGLNYEPVSTIYRYKNSSSSGKRFNGLLFFEDNTLEDGRIFIYDRAIYNDTYHGDLYKITLDNI